MLQHGRLFFMMFIKAALSKLQAVPCYGGECKSKDGLGAIACLKEKENDSREKENYWDQARCCRSP